MHPSGGQSKPVGDQSILGWAAKNRGVSVIGPVRYSFCEQRTLPALTEGCLRDVIRLIDHPALVPGFVTCGASQEARTTLSQSRPSRLPQNPGPYRHGLTVAASPAKVGSSVTLTGITRLAHILDRLSPCLCPCPSPSPSTSPSPSPSRSPNSELAGERHAHPHETRDIAANPFSSFPSLFSPASPHFPSRQCSSGHSMTG